jgi:hypothetical protein
MRKRKRLIYLTVLLFLIAGTGYAVNKALDGIVGEIPADAEPALREAAACFANARVTDDAKRSYSGCIAKIRTIMEGKISDQTLLRCYYYLAFSCFMNKEYDEAHAHASKMLALALRLYSGHSTVKYTAALVENIRDEEIDSLEDINISLVAQGLAESARLGEELRRAEVKP